MKINCNKKRRTQTLQSISHFSLLCHHSEPNNFLQPKLLFSFEIWLNHTHIQRIGVFVANREKNHQNTDIKNIQMKKRTSSQFKFVYQSKSIKINRYWRLTCANPIPFMAFVSITHFSSSSRKNLNPNNNKPIHEREKRNNDFHFFCFLSHLQFEKSLLACKVLRFNYAESKTKQK